MTEYYSTTKMSTQLFEYMDTKYSFEFVSVALRMGYRGIVICYTCFSRCNIIVINVRIITIKSRLPSSN